MPLEYIEVYTYDLSYKCGSHLARLSVANRLFDTSDAAIKGARTSIYWYIDHGFTGSTPDDFVINPVKGYVLKRVDA